MFDKKITFDSFIRGCISALILILLYVLFKSIKGALLPFFIAWLLAYMLYPLVSFFQYKCRLKSRTVSIFVSIAVVIGVLTGLLVLTIPSLSKECAIFVQIAEKFIAQEAEMAQTPGTVPYIISDYLNDMDLQQYVNGEAFTNTLKETLPEVWDLFLGTANVVMSIFTLFIILLYMFFILLDYETFSEGWVNLVPFKHRQMVSTLVSDVEKGMNSYFRGQATVAFFVGVLFCIGFSIIDFPLAILLGVIIGILNLVPYMQLIAVIPTILLALIKSASTGENFWYILGMALVVFAVVQIIQDAILTPRIMGKITGLNPAVILLSLSVWGSLLGILGMIIALPFTTLLLSYYRRYIEFNERKQKVKAWREGKKNS